MTARHKDSAVLGGRAASARPPTKLLARAGINYRAKSRTVNEKKALPFKFKTRYERPVVRVFGKEI
jgi:hypothetical protein